MDARHRQWTDAEVALAADHQAEGLAQASPGQSEARVTPWGIPNTNASPN